MNNAKHTPGPWLAEPEDHEESEFWRIESEDFGGIAYLHDPMAAEMGRTDELEANARLIAAAPELLEALERINSFGAEDFNGNENPLQVCQEIAEAAIAKAKGAA